MRTRSQPRAGSRLSPLFSRARSISDRYEPSAAPQPGGLSHCPSQPSPGALRRTGHLQPAAELLHRAPAGGHRVAQQEHRDAPLLNQPPQHRILWLSGPATEWKGARSVSPESPSPWTTTLPVLAGSQEPLQHQGHLPSCKEEKKKLSLKPLSTYLFRNQLLQLCFFQNHTGKKWTKRKKKKHKNQRRSSEIITTMKCSYICINDEQRVYTSSLSMSN